MTPVQLEKNNASYLISLEMILIESLMTISSSMSQLLLGMDIIERLVYQYLARIKFLENEI